MPAATAHAILPVCSSASECWCGPTPGALLYAHSEQQAILLQACLCSYTVHVRFLAITTVHTLFQGRVEVYSREVEFAPKQKNCTQVVNLFPPLE